ncbi:DUF4230 domain-containing protein [Peptoniphilus catoniae]|uniref:DUF4230 domain-containing protein n=1 Tax=Peptoniphilus catoniae TaxID=1660341 RepID=UPI0010FD5444|nr:DUF4230 domain-containing protein [Peptoniphilus catoniae]
MKKVKNLIIVCLILSALVIGAFFYGKNQGALDKEPVITSELLTNQIKDSKELTVTKYYYTNMASFENQNEFYGFKIPFTQKKFILSYDGIISAGVDLSKLDLSLDKEKKIIKIKMPDAKILSHEINDSSITIFDEKNSVFNPINLEDYSGFYKDQKALMEKKALSKNLLANSKEAAQKAIEEILSIYNTGEDSYTIEFN